MYQHFHSSVWQDKNGVLQKIGANTHPALPLT